MNARALAIGWMLTAALLLGAAALDRSASGERAGAELAWSEVAWPFLTDAWPAGRAFSCAPPACAEKVDLYLRLKLGFCNCYSGVADDDEIDRVGDLALLGGEYRAEAVGRPLELGGLSGRVRRFSVAQFNQPRRHAIGIALANRCDALVAMVVSERELSPSSEEAAFAFIDGGRVMDWVRRFSGS